MRVLTGVRLVKPHLKASRTRGELSLSSHPPPGLRAIFGEPFEMLQNGWPDATKTVSFGRCRFPAKRRATTKQRWQIGLPANAVLPVVSRADPASCQG